MEKIVCPVCKQPTDILRSSIKDGKYLSDRCENCLNSYKGFSDYARKFERDNQRRKFAKDIIQKWEGTNPNPDYIKAYPEQSKKLWGDSVVRDHGVKRKQF